jgi:hypothetical protein
MRFAQFAEQEFGAGEGEAEKFVYAIAERLKDGAANFEFENEDSEGELQAQTPQDGLQLDRFALGGKEIRETEDDRHAQYADKSSHSFSFSTWLVGATTQLPWELPWLFATDD